MRKLKYIVVVVLFFTTGVCVPALAQQDLSAVKHNIQQRLDEHDILGISIARIKPDGDVVYYSEGYLSTERQRKVSKNTIFEIGSISKTFTSLILARMVLQHKVALNDPIDKYLPDSLHVPSYNGQKITLEDLATHTSGLPRMPSNFNPKNPLNPYADYTTRDLYEFLDHYKLTRAPGSKFQYSNLGVGLLGTILAQAADKSYAQLLQQYISGPLEMGDTGLKVSKTKQNRFADPYKYGLPVLHWDWKALAGAGSIRSTVKNLAVYLKAQMGLKETVLDSAITLTHKMRFHINKYRSIGLAWIESTAHDTIIWHNGETGGYRSFTGFNLEKGTGVVVLSSGRGIIDDIGMHLLDHSFPLRPVKKSISVDPEILERYTGTYESNINHNIKYYVSLKGNQLWVQITGQNKFEIYPKSKMRFFYKVTSDEIGFSSVDSSGKAQQLTIYHHGRGFKATRVE